ncbi:MAG: hypothetical protein AAFY26_19910, partial [Cyanobacteria bacterium J06638_22]
HPPAHPLSQVWRCPCASKIHPLIQQHLAVRSFFSQSIKAINPSILIDKDGEGRGNRDRENPVAAKSQERSPQILP